MLSNCMFKGQVLVTFSFNTDFKCIKHKHCEFSSRPIIAYNVIQQRKFLMIFRVLSSSHAQRSVDVGLARGFMR